MKALMISMLQFGLELHEELCSSLECDPLLLESCVPLWRVTISYCWWCLNDWDEVSFESASGLGWDYPPSPCICLLTCYERGYQIRLDLQESSVIPWSVILSTWELCPSLESDHLLLLMMLKRVGWGLLWVCFWTGMSLTFRLILVDMALSLDIHESCVPPWSVTLSVCFGIAMMSVLWAKFLLPLLSFESWVSPMLLTLSDSLAIWLGRGYSLSKLLELYWSLSDPPSPYWLWCF